MKKSANHDSHANDCRDWPTVPDQQECTAYRVHRVPAWCQSHPHGMCTAREASMGTTDRSCCEHKAEEFASDGRSHLNSGRSCSRRRADEIRAASGRLGTGGACRGPRRGRHGEGSRRRPWGSGHWCAGQVLQTYAAAVLITEDSNCIDSNCKTVNERAYFRFHPLMSVKKRHLDSDSWPMIRSQECDAPFWVVALAGSCGVWSWERQRKSLSETSFFLAE